MYYDRRGKLLLYIVEPDDTSWVLGFPSVVVLRLPFNRLPYVGSEVLHHLGDVAGTLVDKGTMKSHSINKNVKRNDGQHKR